MSPPSPETEPPAAARGARGTRRRRLLRTALVLGLCAVGAGGAQAASQMGLFSDGQTGALAAAGTVSLGDDDGGAALVRIVNGKPGDVQRSCIRVGSSGTLPAVIRLYGAVDGPLAAHLQLKVTRGVSSSNSFPSCAGFSPDPADYLGAGSGVVFAGPLSDYPRSYDAALADPPVGGSVTWSGGETHVYRFEMTVLGGNEVQDLASTVDFTWDARAAATGLTDGGQEPGAPGTTTARSGSGSDSGRGSAPGASSDSPARRPSRSGGFSLRPGDDGYVTRLDGPTATLAVVAAPSLSGSRPVRLAGNRRVQVRVQCPSTRPVPCAGTVSLRTLSGRTLKIGTSTMTVAAGHTGQVNIRVSKAVYAKLRAGALASAQVSRKARKSSDGRSNVTAGGKRLARAARVKVTFRVVSTNNVMQTRVQTAVVDGTQEKRGGCLTSGLAKRSTMLCGGW